MVSQVISSKKYDGNVCTICGKPLTRGEVGDTCKAHAGKLRQSASISDTVPNGYIRMSEVCRQAVEQGLKISQIVNASGGDACTKPVLDPVFKVVYNGKKKFMNPDVMTKGFALLKAHLAEKATKPVKPSEESLAIEAVLREEAEN
jgi:hypothetical protein